MSCAFAQTQVSSAEKSLPSYDGLRLEQYRRSYIIRLKESQCRLFQMNQRLKRIAISDPEIVGARISSEREFVLIGMHQGKSTLVIWDTTGGVSCIDLQVEREHGNIIEALVRLRDIVCFGAKDGIQTKFEHTPGDPLKLVERKVSSKLFKRLEGELAPMRPVPITKISEEESTFKFSGGQVTCTNESETFDRFIKKASLAAGRYLVFKSDSELAVVSGNRAVAELVPVSMHDVIVLAKAQGKTTLGFRDRQGNLRSVELTVVSTAGPVESAMKRLHSFLFPWSKKVPNSDIPTSTNDNVHLSETKLFEEPVVLQIGEPRTFQLRNRIVRIWNCSNTVADVAVTAPTRITAFGKLPGKTTFVVWDESGKKTGRVVKVQKRVSKVSSVADVSSTSSGELELDTTQTTPPSVFHDIEVFSAQTKEVESVPFIPLIDDEDSLKARRAIEINNEGVTALNDNEFSEAIRKFEAALEEDPDLKVAKKNLAIARNNYGLQMVRQNPEKALQEFHHAYHLSPNNRTTRDNLNGVIQMMGKDPRKFDVRVELGDKARDSEDIIGAIVEYRAALKIRRDPGIQQKLNELLER